MPPAIPPEDPVSDAESNGTDIPALPAKGEDTQAEDQLANTLQENLNGKAEQKEEDEVEENEEDDEDEEGVYIVDKIVGHVFDGETGEILLRVKWKGYENPDDQTMEPEDNLLDGAKEALDAYYKKVGGGQRPLSPKGPNKASNKRKSIGSSQEATPTAKRPKGRTSAAAKDENEDQKPKKWGNWIPKGDSWENAVQNVDTIERDGKDGQLYVFLHWNNDKKTKVGIERCYKMCPMRMLHFYEQHLVFRES